MSTSSDKPDGGWSPTPRTSKKAKVTHDQSDKMDADVFECRANGPSDENGKVVKGVGAATGKCILTVKVGLPIEQLEPMAEQLSGELRHGKVKAAGPVIIQSKFPDSDPLIIPSSLKCDVFSFDGLEDAIKIVQKATKKEVKRPIKNVDKVPAPTVKVARMSDTRLELSGDIKWLDQDDAAYNWLETNVGDGIATCGPEVGAKPVWTLDCDHHDEADEAEKKAKLVLQYLGYGLRSWSHRTAHAHLSPFPHLTRASPCAETSTLDRRPRPWKPEPWLAGALLAAGDMDAMGADEDLPCEVRKLMCDPSYHHSWVPFLNHCRRVSRVLE